MLTTLLHYSDGDTTLVIGLLALLITQPIKPCGVVKELIKVNNKHFFDLHIYMAAAVIYIHIQGCI
jgi:hypothetical protein